MTAFNLRLAQSLILIKFLL